MLSKLSKTCSKRNAQLEQRPKAPSSLISISVDQQPYEFLSEEHQSLVDLNKVRLQLPSCVHDEYASVLLHESFEKEFYKTKNLIHSGKSKVAFKKVQSMLDQLYETKQQIIHDGEGALDMFKASLVNLLL